MHLIVEEDYAQKASAVLSIRAILEGYPLSAGILRELVQNSDDAGAKKQTFVLDQRSHATGGLYNEGLTSTQGPAFMAFNDAVLGTQDWEALCSMHDSSKTADESKIGKYGVGFRSVFNLTDTPQILSDQHLAIFDPLGLHLGSEGKKLRIGDVSSVFPNQLLPFDFFMKADDVLPFLGTVIRCPLRTSSSRISDQVVPSEVISKLLQEFMDQEMEVSCLFLNNINCIEIHEISPSGISTLLAKMVVSRSDPVSSTIFTTVVQLDRRNQVARKEWHIVESDFPRDEAINMLLQLPGYSLSTIDGMLQGTKFSPEVKIAVDITTDTKPTRGRLFTFLPLPIFTGFPVHIHASFGIDASRTNLRRDSVGLASGSRDHTKVQWNMMLFKTIIPRTWGRLLKELASRKLVSDIFNFWPPETSSGDLESLSSSLSEQLVNTLLEEKANVWPVYEPQNQSTQFRSLESLIVASPNERENLLKALGRVGVSLTRPPKYIFNLLFNSSSKNRILTPEFAHGLLLEKVDKITHATEDQKLLLEYLLSTNNILYICGLPLIPLANGNRMAVSNVKGDPAFTILTYSEFTIFGCCDDLAVPLHQLPPRVGDILKSGPSTINVQRLSVPRIVEYLSTYPRTYLSEGRTYFDVVRWLSRFWEWMSTYEHKDELFPQIQEFFLLPSTKGLRTAKSALFKLRAEPPAYTLGYIAIGVPFLDITFSGTGHHVLESYGLVKSIWDTPALLDSLASTSLAGVSQHECESILKHLVPRLDESIGQDRIQRLRDLPIFPVLTFSMTGQLSSVVTHWTIIPRGHMVRSLGRPKFVPLINGITFVGLNNIAPGILKFLEPSHPSFMSENDLVELAVENLTTQPEHIQLILLRLVTDNQNRIFPAVMAKIRSQAFVLAEDGSYHVPGDIVDPDSDIGPLYMGCPEYRPSTAHREILQCLKDLALLRACLTPDIAAERVEYVSSRHTSDEALLIARNLLLLLASSNMDFSLVQGISEKKWLPTNKGLCSAGECRHPAVTPSALFDKVLMVLTVLGRFTMPPSLQNALGWDKPLPINLLVEQLNGVLNSDDNYDAVVEIFKEFGRRQWSDEDVGFLEKTVRDRQWIPTTGDMLADIKSSVFKFSPTMINSGFYQIRPMAEKLLRRMGCTDHPSTRAILDKLHALDQDSNLVDIVGTSISLLKSLPGVITTVECAKLLIPDKDARLRPVSKVFYNDIGENDCLMNSDGHFIAHQLVDESLARKLGLERLGLRHADLRHVGPNMGQAPITTVRRTLQQYTNKQFLPEFLANAADAKATEFKVAINLTTVNEERNSHVLTSDMAYLCKLPSLVVYNNSQFTSQDFEGICYTSVGGKEGRQDTIGEFGLGVLTMYHFTDLAMVISGSRVLFLDPSKKHLPIPDRASLDLELQRVQKFFKDHLIALDGLFDFNMSMPSYNGTLFVLPLRVCDGPLTPVVPDFWSPERVTSEVLEPFKKLAGDCLLFTDIRTISCFTRAEAAVLQWSFCAKRAQIFLETGYSITDIKVTKPTNSVAHWKTVTTSRSRSQLPSEFQEASRFRRPPFAGLAARLDRASDGHPFSFFSTLPLSSPTTLPMHVMASFKLSSDRRQIRHDDYEKLETRYNTWLLEDLIPPLYLFFLEHLLTSGDEHYHLRWPTKKDDTLSNLIVKNFYSSKHLTSSPRYLFSSLYSPPLLLSPQRAILQANDPRSVRLILSLLKPCRVVNLPPGPRELAALAGVPTMAPNFVKNEIIRKPGAITSDTDFQLILDLIMYLASQKDTPDILCGLPILPLEDGSFGSLAVRGTGTRYYRWKPKDQTKRHNFSERCFIHPEMKTKELMDFRLNVFRLDVSTIKRFVGAKLSTFTEPGVSQAQLQWTDSFWDSWEEYAQLGLIHDDIASFPLVPTTLSSSLVCLEQCKNGNVLLVGGDSQENYNLHSCLRELGLPVVHIDGPIPDALRKILEKDVFPRLNLQNVLSAISRTGAQIPDVFDTLSDDLRTVFANWAKANVSQISKDQIPLAQCLPIWWSAGGGTQPALRPSSEVQLLPEKLTIQDAAFFMADCVAEDASLTHLHKRHMTFNELPHQLRLPDVLDMPTLLQYKQFYNSWITYLPSSNLLSGSQHCRPLPVPTSACTFRSPQDMFKRGPLFTAVFPEGSPFFVHAEFQEYEEVLCNFGLKTEEGLDVGMFTTCAESLASDLDDPNAVPRAREVFRAYSDILPRRIGAQEHDTWRELDDMAFIPRRMDTVRRLPDQGENTSGLEIPMAVTQLPAILSPGEFVRQEYEAVAWSQCACFEEQPSPRVCLDYPELGKPSFSVVLTHLRYLSEPVMSMRSSQRQILLNDLKEVYQYFIANLELLRQNEELAQTTLFALRDERLFLNIDEEGDQLNWVQGSSLAFDCNVREGPIQDVRKFLRPFETILIASGALKVKHPSYNPDHANIQRSESVKLQNIWSSFDQLRKEKAFTDVEFITCATDVLNPNPMFAHRVFLAASSEYFKEYFRGDFIESGKRCPDGLHTLKVEYSPQCVQSFLDYIYTGNKGENFTLELLLEILHLSDYYHVKDLFDEVQGEIMRRKLLSPETLDKVKAEAEKLQAECLLNACTQYILENAEFIRRSSATA